MSDAPKSSWRRFLLASLLFLALVGGLGFGVFAWMQNRAGSRLREAITELDVSDPGWQLDELMAARPAIPPREDSGPRIMAIVHGLSRGWPHYAAMEDWDKLQPNLAFDEKRMAELDKLLAGLGPQVKAARELLKHPRGRHRLLVARNPLATLLPDHQETRRVAQLLDLDARERALRGDAAQALLDARAMLALSNVFDDDPFLISALIRIATQSLALKCVERTLALVEASDADLEAFQKALEPYTKKTGMEFAMRGERATMHRVVGLLAAGEIDAVELGAGSGTGARPWWRWFTDAYLRQQARNEHPEFLRLMTRTVEAAKLSPDKQADAEEKLDKEIKASRSVVVRQLMPATQKVGQAGRRGLAQARAMWATVAVERYRMKHGTWPAKLSDAMDKVPLDPIDAKPLRYAPWADGVVVYSIGNDRKDDGGDVANMTKDFGYRLWDVKKRKQPAPPKKAVP